jgi:site-specific recombinase XerD
MHLCEAHALFQTQLAADGRSASTRTLYRVTIEALERWLAAEGHPGEIEQIDHVALARFVASDAFRLRNDGKPKTSATLNTMRSVLRVFGRYCHASGLTTTDFARLLKRAICTPAPPRALSQRDQQKLLGVLEGEVTTAKERRDQFLVRFLLATGLRLESALLLDVEDVDLDDGSMRVHAKRDRVQVFYFGAAVREELRAFLAGRAEGPVFRGAAGRRLGKRQAQRRVGDLARRAGLGDTRPHALRHSFAVELYERSADIALVSRALGHASIVSTLRYASATDEQLRRAMGA